MSERVTSVRPVLAICGSLRAASQNALLLRALPRLAPLSMQIDLYPSIGNLPLFNPDLERPEPSAVAQLRGAITAADALIIASPEYAHGISGPLKNALDWLVGNESMVNKPVAVLNASPRAYLAQQALRETLTAMSARVIHAACVQVALLGSGLNEEGVVADAHMSAALSAALSAGLSQLRQALP